MSLDLERCWYGYHHLFADLLQTRLKQVYPPDKVIELHTRAAAWCEQNELIPEGDNHMLSMGILYPTGGRRIITAANPGAS